MDKQILPVSLWAVLGFTSVSWLTITSITIQSVQASTARVEVSLNRQTDEGYDSLLRRAEAVARAAAQRSFDSNILVTEVEVTVLGQNQGTIVPILLLEVSRPAWRNRPDPQLWSTYFPTTKALLRFEEPQIPPGTRPPAPEPIPATPAPTIIEIPGGTPSQIRPMPSDQRTGPQSPIPDTSGTSTPGTTPTQSQPTTPETTPTQPQPTTPETTPTQSQPAMPETTPSSNSSPSDLPAPKAPTTQPPN
ncbi:hypothetical protein [Lyngbya aestuarii]|uniref:hypothetical protein n=1 Tax=Lyngbya aestuarii TaxID=118322 RepID=UPI00403DDF4A